MFSAHFIGRPRLAMVLSVIILIAGAISLLNLPILQYPDVTPPTVRVSAAYPGASAQVVGVFDRALVRPVAEALARLGAERALVVHGADGLDELTITGPTFVAEWDGATIREWTIEPEALGLPRRRVEDLAGGTAEQNAALTRLVLGDVDAAPLPAADPAAAHRDLHAAGRCG